LKIFKPLLIFLLLLLSVVDEIDRLKHQQNGKHQFEKFYDDNDGGDGVNNISVQKCFVFLKGPQGKWTGKRKISLNRCFKRLCQLILDLKVRLIEAFPVKMELQIVNGYVYRFKRAAGGYAQFLNSLVFQLVQKWQQNHSIYHGVEVREENVFWPFSASICTSILTTFLASFFTSVFTLFFM
jgi:hypothetical protein